MPTSEARKLVNAFGVILKKNRIDFKKIYLYGSYATGKAHEHSDIDVAVVFGNLKRGKGYLDKTMKIRHLSCQIDPRIEPILLAEKDLKRDQATIMGNEVRKHGILVVNQSE